MRGISMSTTTRSKGAHSKASMASTPSPASVTSAPSMPSIWTATIWLVGVSSARRIRTPASDWLSDAGAVPSLSKAGAPSSRTSWAAISTRASTPSGRLKIWKLTPTSSASVRTIWSPRPCSPFGPRSATTSWSRTSASTLPSIGGPALKTVSSTPPDPDRTISSRMTPVPWLSAFETRLPMILPSEMQDTCAPSGSVSDGANSKRRPAAAISPLQRSRI